MHFYIYVGAWFLCKVDFFHIVFHIALAIYQVTVNIPDVECGGGFYVRSLVSDIGKGRHEKTP